jgi:Carbohydrate-binding family 9
MENYYMKKLNIPLLQLPKDNTSMDKVSEFLEKYGVGTEIDIVNWENFNYKPDVKLFCAYTEMNILLKYIVTEKNVLAFHTDINAPVFEDSCVEFFISTGNGFYYNFEFNCIGNKNVGYGKQREGRTMLSKTDISAIRTLSSLGNEGFDLREISDPWELTIAIPFNIFSENEFRNPQGKTFNVNFYKCGDKLPDPHFLSWNPIEVSNPDFHRPEFFGEITFV